MKSQTKIIVCMAILTLVVFVSCTRQSSIEILFENPSELERIDEPVILTRQQIAELLPGGIPGGLIPIVESGSDSIIPSQVDDLDGDGEWDELFMLITLEPSDKMSLKLTLTEPDLLPEFTQRSNVWLASPQEDGSYKEVKQAPRPSITRENYSQTKLLFQFEGPGWENDRVGFRNYIDERNGMDIFGKTTEKMVLQNVGINEDYHALQDWGMDILKVDKSLGAGSIALEIDGKLNRVGPGSGGSYELVTNGPLRSLFRYRFDNWMIEGIAYTVIHEICIHGGSWYYTSKVSVEGVRDDARVVSGITTVALEEKKATFTDHDNGVVSLFTHGRQSISGEFLGMAMMVNKVNYIDFEYLDEKPEDINHTFIVRMNLSKEPTSFRFYSGWELSDEKFAKAEKFEELLKHDALIMGNPVKVTLK